MLFDKNVFPNITEDRITNIRNVLRNFRFIAIGVNKLYILELTLGSYGLGYLI